SYHVIGTKGDLRVDQAFDTDEEMEEVTTISERTQRRRSPRRDQFAPELVYFSDCVLHGRQPEPSGAEGLADVRVIRALLRSIVKGRAVSFDPMHKRRRPTM